MNSDTQYMLVIRVDKNNYRPLEWEQLPEYNKEDLTSLEGIDQFTSKQKEYNLLIGLKQHLLDGK